MNPYHSWLIRRRIYCEHEGCADTLTHAEKVIKRSRKDIVVCKWHSYQPIEQGLRERGRLEELDLWNSLAFAEMKLILHHLKPPIATRSFDWICYQDGCEDGLHGYGETPEQALEQWQEYHTQDVKPETK